MCRRSILFCIIFICVYFKTIGISDVWASIPVTNSIVVPDSTFSIRGRVISLSDGADLPGAHVFYNNATSPITVSNKDGEFSLKGIKAGKQNLKVSFIGMQSDSISFNLRCDTLLIFRLMEMSNRMDEVVISQVPPLIFQNGDTTQYNVAALKLNEDAMLLDILKKLPGFRVVDGKITVNGEVVERFLVDGTSFFDKNPSNIIASLPSNFVSKIKLYDDKTEESKFSNYDDGKRVKTLDVRTLDAKKLKMFGNADVGVGVDFYNAGLTFGAFNDGLNVSASGKFGMNTPDKVLDMAKYRDDGGNLHTQNYGASLSYGNDTSVIYNGNYHYTKSNNYRTNISYQDYFPTDYFLSRIYQNEGHSWNDQNDVNLFSSVQWKINRKNRLNLSIVSNFGNSDDKSLSFNESIQNDTLLMSSRSLSNQNNSNNSINASSKWMLNLKKRGRMLNTSIAYDRRKAESDGTISEVTLDTVNNWLVLNDNVSNHSNISLFYSEPFAKGIRLSVTFSQLGEWTLQDNKRLSYADSTFSNSTFLGIDTSLTNRVENRTLDYSLALSANYFKNKIMLTSNMTVKKQFNRNKYVYPNRRDSVVNNSYLGFTPNVFLSYRMSSAKEINFTYSGESSSPSSSQLRNVLTVNGPLNVSRGNASLKNSYRQSFELMFSTNKFTDSTSLGFNGNLNFSNNYNGIGQGVSFINTDTVINGYKVVKGARLTMPVNMKGGWSITAGGSLSNSLLRNQVIFQNSLSLSYNKNPSFNDGKYSYSKDFDASHTINLSLSFSEKWDFSIDNNIVYNYSNAENAVENDYFVESFSTFFSWRFYKRFRFISRYNLKWTTGNLDKNANNYNNSLSLTIEKSVFKNKSGLIRFTANNVLEIKDGTSYTVNELYRLLSYSSVKNRLFELKFIYRFKRLGKGQRDSVDM